MSSRVLTRAGCAGAARQLHLTASFVTTRAVGRPLSGVGSLRLSGCAGAAANDDAVRSLCTSARPSFSSLLVLSSPTAAFGGRISAHGAVASSLPFAWCSTARRLPAWRWLSSSSSPSTSSPSSSSSSPTSPGASSSPPTSPSSPASFSSSKPTETSSAAPSPFSTPASSSFASAAAAAATLPSSTLSLSSGWLERVQAASQIQLFHMSHMVLLVAIPAALVLSPSMLVAPLDLGLGLLIPWHSHVGMVNVLEDYVPKPYRRMAVLTLSALSLLTALGLLKVNLCGAGLTESFKSLWRQPALHVQPTTTTIVQRVRATPPPPPPPPAQQLRPTFSPPSHAAR